MFEQHFVLQHPQQKMKNIICSRNNKSFNPPPKKKKWNSQRTSLTFFPPKWQWQKKTPPKKKPRAKRLSCLRRSLRRFPRDAEDAVMFVKKLLSRPAHRPPASRALQAERQTRWRGSRLTGVVSFFSAWVSTFFFFVGLVW